MSTFLWTVGDYYSSGDEETYYYGTSYYIDVQNEDLNLSGTTGSVTFSRTTYETAANTIVGKYVKNATGNVIHIDSCYSKGNAKSRFNVSSYGIVSSVTGYGLTLTNKYSTPVVKGNSRYSYHSTLN